jgi:aminoglycoside 2''-phosphotransferase
MNENTEHYRGEVLSRYPELNDNSFRFLSEGSDNMVFLMGDNLIFRFSKTGDSVQDLRSEIRVLRELAPRLPLEVPNYIYAQIEEQPPISSVSYFVGYPLITGVPMSSCPVALLDVTSEWWRPILAQFLNAIHAYPETRARELGIQYRVLKIRACGESSWRESLSRVCKSELHQLTPVLMKFEREAVERAVDLFMNDHLNGVKSVLIHGDFTPEHVFLDLENRRVSGIIDFSDLAIGDPASDVWLSLIPWYGASKSMRLRRTFYFRFGLLRRLAKAARGGEAPVLAESLVKFRAAWSSNINATADDCP